MKTRGKRKRHEKGRRKKYRRRESATKKREGERKRNVLEIKRRWKQEHNVRSQRCVEQTHTLVENRKVDLN